MLPRLICCMFLALTLKSCADDIDANEPQTPILAHISGTLPVLYINTENQKPITSKTEYINADYWLDPFGKDDVAPLGSEAEPLPMQIRGRGHSSWKGPKKPYKIKLGEKTAIMGMPKNKHWALLKPTENTVAGLQLGKLMNMSWTPSFRPVEVVLNGDYIGLYFLTETIRIGKNRVNIYEQQDKETNPELISGGWLVEVDNYHDECQITIPENNRWNLEGENAVRLIIKQIGDRPAGANKDDASVIQAAYGTLQSLSIPLEKYTLAATDQNVPLFYGLPATTLGAGGIEANNHSLSEWWEAEDAFQGPQVAFLTALTLVGVNGVTEPLLEKQPR